MDQSPTTLAEDRGPIPSDWTTSAGRSRNNRTSTTQTAPGSRVAACSSNADAGAPATRSPAALPTDLAPLDPAWTVADLLIWLADDVRMHDPALRHPLSLVDLALTGATWTGAPSTVALIRSIAEAVRRTPAAGSIRLERLLA